MATRMQQRRGTAQQWTDADPILASGEIGFETDTTKFKIGDGVNHWSDLTYYVSADGIADLVDGAPELLNTLNELAAAIGDDPTFVSTVTNGLASKLDLDGGIMTGDLTLSGAPTSNLHAATKAYVDSEITSQQNYTDSEIAAQETYTDNAAYNERLYAAQQLSLHSADTTNIHGIADTTALATKTYADGVASDAENAASSALTAHNNDTTDVHGIADTSLLATTTDVSDAQDAAETYADDAVSVHNLDTTSVHGIADTTALATKTYADNAVSTHSSDTTDVHGISDTSALATKTYADNSVSSHNAVTTDVHGISDTSKLVTTDGTQTLTNKTITSPSGLVKADVGLGNVDNTSDADKPISDDTQAALDLKAPKADPTFTGTVTLPSTTSIGNVSATEIGYVDGVTSAIQTQLNAKAPLAGPTFTGTVNAADLILSGNLTVQGTTTTVDTQDLVVSDPMIYIGEGNSANLVDLGFVSSFDNGTYQHSGLVRDASDNKWKLFKGVTDEPTTTVNFTQASLDALAVGELEASSLTVGSVSNTELGYLDGVTSAIQTQLDAKSTASKTETLTNKSISLTTNTVSGTKAEFNAAMSDADFATLAGTETLTNKTLTSPSMTSPTVSSGALTVSSSGITFADGTQTGEGVLSRTPIISKSASYTLSALSERDSLIEMNSGSAVTLTIPTNATLALPVGTSIDVLAVGAGAVTIAGAAGVTVNATPGLILRTQWSACTLFKRATDTWVVYGDLKA